MIDPRARLAATFGPVRQAAALLRNRLAGPALAYRARERGPVPEAAVAVFATGPENFYQFEQWRLPLEHLALQRPVFVIVDRRTPGIVLQTSSLRSLLRAAAALEELVADRDVRWCSTSIRSRRTSACCDSRARCTFRLGTVKATRAEYLQPAQGVRPDLRRRRRGSRSPRPRAARIRCDRAHAGGGPAAARLQLSRRPAWPRDSGLRVWYAPTWEGDRPSIAYGSLASHGVAIIEALLADPSIRVIYRPHPDRVCLPQHRDADRRSACSPGPATGTLLIARLRLAVGLRRCLHHRYLSGCL